MVIYKEPTRGEEFSNKFRNYIIVLGAKKVQAAVTRLRDYYSNVVSIV